MLLNAIKRMFGFEGTYNAELKELDNSVDDLETINMWAELSDVSNAACTTLNRTPETTTISRSDIAKIIKDA